MLGKKRVLALIPARGGSKRLPRKNIMSLDGIPLIGWTIKAAQTSNYIDEIVVSTDDDEVATIAKNLGASVPFKRPDYLASDVATSHSVIKHCLDYYENERVNFDIVVLLQPTSPLRTAAHIDAAMEIFQTKGAKSVISVCECDHSPLWSNVLPDNCSMENFLNKELLRTRSQDLPKHYRISGAIYICDIPEYISSDGDFYNGDSYAYKMDASSSIDIDTDIDFKLANLIIKERKNK